MEGLAKRRCTGAVAPAAQPQQPHLLWQILFEVFARLPYALQLEMRALHSRFRSRVLSPVQRQRRLYQQSKDTHSSSLRLTAMFDGCHANVLEQWKLIVQALKTAYRKGETTALIIDVLLPTNRKNLESHGFHIKVKTKIGPLHKAVTWVTWANAGAGIKREFCDESGCLQWYENADGYPGSYGWLFHDGGSAYCPAHAYKHEM